MSAFLAIVREEIRYFVHFSLKLPITGHLSYLIICTMHMSYAVIIFPEFECLDIRNTSNISVKILIVNLSWMRWVVCPRVIAKYKLENSGIWSSSDINRLYNNKIDKNGHLCWPSNQYANTLHFQYCYTYISDNRWYPPHYAHFKTKYAFQIFIQHVRLFIVTQN